MSINSVGYGNALLGQSVFDLKNQLDALQTQLATGKKSTTYSGMGVNEGFAIFARAQLSNLSAFATTITNINTTIDTTSTALTSFGQIATQVKSAAGSGGAIVNGSGQTTGQQTALLQLKTMLEMLNTQAGDRYLFSGSAIDTPSVASMEDILNGKGAQAGLKQLIAERNQADLGVGGMGRLVVSSPTPTSVSVAEDVAGSPFGLKLNAIASSLTGATVTGPSGSPAAVSVNLASNPNNGDNITFTFNLPDGTTEAVRLTASNATPPPTGSFAIGATPTATTANLNAALNTAIGTLANTALVAASAMAASDNFFNSAGTATGGVVNNKAAAPITGATLLSGGAATDSLATNFAAGDTITVNGTPISFVAAGATGNQLNVTDSVQTLLARIDSITGTSVPSTVSGGVIALHTDNAASLSVTSSNPAAFAALGFGATATAILPPLRVGGTPWSTATSLVSGAANTVAWYTGEAGPGPARASSTARIDQAATIQYGVRANEQAIRNTLQSVAAFAAFTMSPTGPNATAQISALNQRVATSLTPQGRQQSLADIGTDLASAQVAMKGVAARQSQSQIMLQSLVDQTETVSTDQVATEILAVQTRLQASYQTTSMLSQLTLVKYLPVG
ncbi:flagellar protein [Bradyrhizobium sp.]|uniref:flagellar protein n=1 Tax=Bradyrhizobium sp. TaxID=376 RepID=UPI003C737C27